MLAEKNRTFEEERSVVGRSRGGGAGGGRGGAGERPVGARRHRAYWAQYDTNDTNYDLRTRACSCCFTQPRTPPPHTSVPWICMKNRKNNNTMH